MSYVVGFLGSDGHLGRTFFAKNMDEALVALEALRSEQQDVFRLPDEEEMQDDAQRLRAYFKWRSEQQDVFRLPDEEEMQDDAQRLRAYFEENCVLNTELGSYFVGGLEKVA